MTNKLAKGALGVLAMGGFVIAFMLADVSVFSESAKSSTATPQESAGETQEDLSGTYTGKITMTGAHEMSGTATLTVTGNTFTLEGEGMSHNGRISAEKTRGYIGATLMFMDIDDADTKTKLAASVRVRKGNTLSLSPVQGSKNKLTFSGKKTA